MFNSTNKLKLTRNPFYQRTSFLILVITFFVGANVPSVMAEGGWIKNIWDFATGNSSHIREQAQKNCAPVIEELNSIIDEVENDSNTDKIVSQIVYSIQNSTQSWSTKNFFCVALSDSNFDTPIHSLYKLMNTHGFDGLKPVSPQYKKWVTLENLKELIDY